MQLLNMTSNHRNSLFRTAEYPEIMNTHIQPSMNKTPIFIRIRLTLYLALFFSKIISMTLEVLK